MSILPDGLRCLLEEASIPVSLADADAPDQALVLVNRAFERLTGYERDEIIGHNCRFLQGRGTDPGVRRRLAAAIAQHRPVAATLANYRKDGRPFDNFLIIRSLASPHGNLRLIMGCRFVVAGAVDAAKLRAHLDEENHVFRDVADALETAHRRIDDCRRMSAESIFLSARHHLQRAERQGILQIDASA